MPTLADPQLLAVVASLGGAGVMLAWRYRETTRPVSGAAIVLPPLAMSAGLLMFALPAARIPWSWALAAFLAGALVLFRPLARTSRLELREGAVVLRRSPAFLAILLGLLALRFLLREFIGEHLSLLQTGAVLFLLAFGMVGRWRLDMLARYRHLSSDSTAA
jgi:membrane protein CcdC involved in cytochrome C biogenesis